MSEVSDTKEMRLAIAAIFRNERPYIVEWLAFHRVIGFDSFYIADNASNDGSTELLQALDRLHLLKWVPFPSPPGQAPQLPAYAQLLTRHVTDEDWIAVIDADEFIMPMAEP
ncbi:glycosyltransferase family 2 protein, partial [Arthrospira platensis SPKY1]|nr:glycosyltransferase family 2 protein [Arthrospira platensis SPKY1]